ncbi:uncharacterized protein FIBRA_04263 [Fibroporia radiculosa]|uniref:TRP C-terminal domain-containing protein n=1 Tax=Fibroporia radiculosa TaxID=599839 RepID=J4H2V5_9APHY|nr:uncharacterized protein FIBRA_04263 [Fibroporia radiculosa]CCM02184.1 predicted protein [Fibroporia radiculosa]
MTAAMGCQSNGMRADGGTETGREAAATANGGKQCPAQLRGRLEDLDGSAGSAQVSSTLHLAQTFPLALLAGRPSQAFVLALPHSFTMSTQHPAQPDPYPSSAQSHPCPPKETKAPYDDLIDQYATSYKPYSAERPLTDVRQHNPEPIPLYPLASRQSNYSDISFKDAKDFDDHVPQHLDLGYPPKTSLEQGQDKPSRNFWGVLRAMFIPDSLSGRLYLLTVLVETAIDLAVEAELYLRLRQTGSTSGDSQESEKMPVYLSIFAIAHVFQYAMALDAVYARNTLQFIALTIFNALLLFYAIIEINEIGNPPVQSGISIHTLTIIIPIVISVAHIAYMTLGWKIYTEFGWKVYKFLGADRRIKSMYAHYQIFLCLMKFDLFFWIGFSVQFIWLVLSAHNAEYYLTCAAFPVSLLVLIIGHLAVRRENKWMMLTFMTGCAGAMVYFTYKLVKVVQLRNTSTYVDVWRTLAIFSVIAIILLLSTSVFACIVMNNFGKGLKAQMAKSSDQGRRRGKSQDIHRGPMSTHPNRMSIE